MPALGKWLRLPGLRGLRPLAHRIASIAAPTGQLSFRSQPSQTGVRNRPEISVLSANLYHDWPRHRNLRQRLEGIAQLIEDENVDVALLQEVARTPWLRSDEWLAERLGMAYVYSRANGHESALGFEEGLAVFSRFPLSRPVLSELRPVLPFTRRLGLGVEVTTNWGKLHAISVHLSLIPSQNMSQVGFLRDWVTSVTENLPAFIGGDFNAHENTPQIGRTQDVWIDTYRHPHPEADGTTHEFLLPWGGSWRRRRLDYLFLQPGKQPWEVLEACHLDAPDGRHSDHRAVLARMRARV